jgi:probable addiction module antidote protein
MDKKKTSSARKRSLPKSMKINGIRLRQHDSSAVFKNHKEIKKALAEALLDGDKEAFVEILSGYVRAHNILEVCRRTGLSRTVVYEAIGDKANPSLDTLCRIMTSFNEAA